MNADKKVSKQEQRRRENPLPLAACTLILLGFLLLLVAQSSHQTLWEYFPIQLFLPGWSIQILGIAYFEIYFCGVYFPALPLSKTGKNRRLQWRARAQFYAFSIWFLLPIPVWLFTFRFYRYVIRIYYGFQAQTAAAITYLIIAIVITVVLLLFAHQQKRAAGRTAENHPISKSKG